MRRRLRLAIGLLTTACSLIMAAYSARAKATTKFSERVSAPEVTWGARLYSGNTPRRLLAAYLRSQHPPRQRVATPGLVGVGNQRATGRHEKRYQESSWRRNRRPNGLAAHKKLPGST